MSDHDLNTEAGRAAALEQHALRPVQSFFVDEEPAPYARPAPLTGGPDCPCADDPYGCDGACVGA